MIRRESVETQDSVSYQDMEVDDDKRLEELGFLPSAVGVTLRVKHMCDKKCKDMGFKFYDLAAIVTEEVDTPHTTNLCRDCYHCRLEEQSETKGSNVVWKEMIRQNTSRGRLGAALGSDGFIKRTCERFSITKRGGQSICWMR